MVEIRHTYRVREYLEVSRIFVDRLAPLDVIFEHVIIHYEWLLSRSLQRGVIEQPEGLR